MPDHALDTFAQTVRPAWRTLSSELVATCRDALAELLQAPSSGPWLRALHRNGSASQELYRDPDHGFVLLAHLEPAGLYRPSHDHGGAWVVYGVQQGEIEMRTFGRAEDPAGQVQLVQRDSLVLRAGQVQAYLPQDIHDTRCLSDTALLFRLTARDLKVEDGILPRITRYPAPTFAWTSGR